MAAIRQMFRKVKEFLRKFYDKNTIRRIALTILAAVLLVYVIVSIPVWTLKSETPPETISRQPLEGTPLSPDAGQVTVAENGGRTLTVNTADMTFEVKDGNTGERFRSYIAGSGSGSELALLSLTYLGADNNLHEWNSYDNCVALSSYTMHRIENGVRIDINLNEGESNRFYEYLPKKMSVETYEERFVGTLKQLMADGTLEEATGNRYLSTLSLVYTRSLTEECYAVSYTGNPPTSATNQMIEVTRLVGYTTDMLMGDAETFGFTVEIAEPAEFDLVVELTLDENGELKAHVPSGSIVSHNDYYTPQSVALLPNFGAAAAEEYEDGYILVPDGSGALVKFNSYIANVTDYKRPFYDNDYFTDYYYMPEYAQELNMPVYGMLYGSAEKTQKGILAIIEEGARTAYMNIRLASLGADSAKYNKAYTSFEIAQYKRVKINGEYSSNSGTYLVNTGMQELDLTVRYRFFGRNTTYFDLAKSYQTYLAQAEGITAGFDNGAAELYLEVVGGLNISSRFIGIPYSRAYSMTTFRELQSMMESLGDVRYQLQYDGAFNGGMNGSLNRGAGTAARNGSRSELKKVLAYAEEKGIPLYLQAALAQVWEGGNGFRASRQAVRDYANNEVEISRYQYVLGILNAALNDGVTHDDYYLLSPKYLSAVTESFLKEAGDYKNLAIPDLAGMYYADYRYENYISGESGNMVLEDNLEKLSENKSLALADPHIDKIGYGSVATDVARESSNHVTFYTTIPFKQLVMNGLIDYTTENVNLSSRNAAYFVLQAAELGSSPKFILTCKNVDVLKNSDFSYLFSAQFELQEEKIKAIYQECSAVRERIGTSEIVGHEVIEDGVYRTVYANGVEVLVNYNLYDVTLSDGTVLQAEGYLIKEGM